MAQKTKRSHRKLMLVGTGVPFQYGYYKHEEEERRLCLCYQKARKMMEEDSFHAVG